MAADLQTVVVVAQVVGVVDGPARQPEHLLLELAQEGELVHGHVIEFGHWPASSLSRTYAGRVTKARATSEPTAPREPGGTPAAGRPSSVRPAAAAVSGRAWGAALHR